jgi:hypothetical protein
MSNETDGLDSGALVTLTLQVEPNPFLEKAKEEYLASIDRPLFPDDWGINVSLGTEDYYTRNRGDDNG